MKMPRLQIARDSIAQDVPVAGNTTSDTYLTTLRGVFACPGGNNKNL